jgi:hypothetical protein
MVKIAISMNKSTFRKPERINEIYDFLGISNGSELPLIENTKNTIDTQVTNDNIAGIIDGDGSVWVSFDKNGRIRPGFSITMDTASIPLLTEIRKFFNNIGYVKPEKPTFSSFFLHAKIDLIKEIIPFMDLNPIFSERAGHYDIFRKVCFMLGSENPLTLKTKLEIVELAYNANKGGKRRRILKADYIKLLKEIHSDRETVL